jgi:uracil phosphoribosyltransferase
MMASTAPSLPSNVHVSTHPCIQAKLCQLRSVSTHPKDFKSAIHEVALLVAAEAYAKVFRSTQDGTVRLPLEPAWC